MHSLKGEKRRFGKREITSRSNYEMFMLYTFLLCTICVPLKLNVIKRNLVALLSERPSYLILVTNVRQPRTIDVVCVMTYFIQPLSFYSPSHAMSISILICHQEAIIMQLMFIIKS